MVDDQTILARGMGYVPGIVQGISQRRDTPSDTGIALITQAQVGKLAHMPAGIIVLDGAPFSHLFDRAARIVGIATVIEEARIARFYERLALWPAK